MGGLSEGDGEMGTITKLRAQWKRTFGVKLGLRRACCPETAEGALAVIQAQRLAVE